MRQDPQYWHVSNDVECLDGWMTLHVGASGLNMQKEGRDGTFAQEEEIRVDGATQRYMSGLEQSSLL
jgi:hypothetical protein